MESKKAFFGKLTKFEVNVCSFNFVGKSMTRNKIVFDLLSKKGEYIFQTTKKNKCNVIIENGTNHTMIMLTMI